MMSGSQHSRRMVPMTRSQNGVGPRRPDGTADHLDTISAEHGVEAGRELGVAVADQELASAEAIRQFPRALGDPRLGRVGGDARQMDPPDAVFNEDEHVDASEQHGVDGEEVTGQDACGLGFEELGPAGPPRRGAGSTLCRRRISHTVDGANLWPTPTSSPWIRGNPRSGSRPPIAGLGRRRLWSWEAVQVPVWGRSNGERRDGDAIGEASRGGPGRRAIVIEAAPAITRPEGAVGVVEAGPGHLAAQQGQLMA
jgi:hypothetical protein